MYNVLLHPLRAYPGPKLYTAFRLPYVIDQLSGRLARRAKQFHDQYGPVVRIAPDELCYTTAAAWKDIFGYRPDHSQLPKDLRVLPPEQHTQAPDIIHADDANHGRMRRLLGYGFSPKALEEQHGLIMSYADSLIGGLRQRCAEPQDLVAWYNWLTFDLIGDLAFGESFDCLRDQRYHPWVKTLFKGINGGVAISAAHRYGLAGLLTSLIPASMMKEFELMWSYTRDKAARRMEKHIERPDFISFLMRNDRDQKEMSKDEVIGNSLTLVVAGSETTATLLAGCTYHLTQNPKVLSRVTKEVRDAFQSEEEITFAAVSKLEYLTAVLKESMRIYPPAPSNIPRRTKEKGAMIDGQWVPPHVRSSFHLPQARRIRWLTTAPCEQTSVGLFQWACNHSSSNFHDPDSFRPERWLDNPPREFAADSRAATQPFSYGPRNCLGQK